MANAERIITNRGSVKIAFEGYLYNKNKCLKEGWVSYECEYRPKKRLRDTDCKARIKVRENDVIKNDVEHTHAPDPAKIEALKTKMSLIQRAANTQETSQQILSTCLAETSAGKTIIFNIFDFFVFKIYFFLYIYRRRSTTS